MNQLWNELAGRAGVRLDEHQQALLSRYLDLLLEANRRMNLTRITERADAEVRHVGDALTLLPHLPAGPIRLVDVGSGGGVPGMPLAIVRPETQVVLVEATRKKAAFLCQAAAALELMNVSVDDRRAEEAGRAELRRVFDVAVARAAGRLVWLAEWCLPLVKKGGKLLAMKGPRAEQEIAEAQRAIGRLGGGAVKIHPADLPGIENHIILEITKSGSSPEAYPRPATAAKGRPLV